MFFNFLHYSLTFCILLLFGLRQVGAQTGCTTYKYEIPVIPARTILSHQCNSGTNYYVIPIDNGN
jgi:hypothetical protein